MVLGIFKWAALIIMLSSLPAGAISGYSGEAPQDVNIFDRQLLIGTTEPVQVTGSIVLSSGTVTLENSQLLVGTTEAIDAFITNSQLLVGTTEEILVGDGSGPLTVDGSVDANITNSQLLVGTTKPLDVNINLITTTGTVIISTVAVRGNGGSLMTVNTDGSINVNRLALGGKDGKMFHLVSGTLNAMGSEENEFLIVNLSTNTASIIFQSLLFSSISGSDLNLRMYLNPVVISSGTPKAVLQTIHPATASSKMNAYSNPTTSSRGTEFSAPFIDGNTFRIPYDGSIIISPGGKFLITSEATGNNKKFSIDLFWREDTLN